MGSDAPTLRRTTLSRIGAALSAIPLVIGDIGASGATGPERAAPLTDPRTGEQIYHQACSACHGADGTGAARTTVGFAAPLPDFTDCNFATREANSDWEAIVRDGAPVRG